MNVRCGDSGEQKELIATVIQPLQRLSREYG